MEKDQLLVLLNRKPLEIDMSFIERQIAEKVAEMKKLEGKILDFIASYKITIAENFATDRFQKWFLNNKMFKSNRVVKISVRLLEELYAETKQEYFLILLQYRKLNDSLKRYQLLRDSIDADGKIQPEFSINSAQSIYTSKPALVFSIQELEQILKAQSYYCETLDEALKFVSSTSNELIAIIKTTIYFRQSEKNSFQKHCEHVGQVKNSFMEMMDLLADQSNTKYGYLRIDFEEQKLLEERIDFEGLIGEARYEYWLTKVMQTAFRRNMKLVKHQIMKRGELINSIFIISEEEDLYIVRLMVHRSKGIRFGMLKNPENQKGAESVLGYPIFQVFESEAKLRKAYANYLELNQLASCGDLDAWELVNKLYVEFEQLDQSSIDVQRFYLRMIKGFPSSMVLEVEKANKTAASEMYTQLVYEKIKPREFEVRQVSEAIKKKEKWINENLGRGYDYDRRLKAKLNDEIKEMQAIIEKKEQELKELLEEVRRLERGIEGSVNYILKQIISKHAKVS